MLGWDRIKAGKKAAQTNTKKRADFYSFIAGLKSNRTYADYDIMHDSRNEYVVAVGEGERIVVEGGEDDLIDLKSLVTSFKSRREARVYKRKLKRDLGLKNVFITQYVFNEGFIVSKRRVY